MARTIPAATGAQGPQGPAGATGAQGNAGTPGDAGAQGEQGIQGTIGNTGQQGIQGTQGVPGDPGSQGIPGDTGSQGSQGVPGDDGAQGIQGIPGDPATNLVLSVAGRTGAVVLAKADVGLGSAENTSDAGKPVSTATQAALDAKQASGSYATGTGTANGTNTGDNATNTQYSGLAASKQDTLVSGTNIKTINGSSVLGSGDLTVSSAASIPQTEIDFGSTPVYEKSFTVTDANVGVGSKLIGGIAYVAPTGRDLDEVEMEPFNVRFAPGDGSFTVWAQALEGPVVDKYKLNYQIGA